MKGREFLGQLSLSVSKKGTVFHLVITTFFICYGACNIDIFEVKNYYENLKAFVSM
jgi:hypothetical protein